MHDWCAKNIDKLCHCCPDAILSGYYRVNYDTTNWLLLTDTLFKNFSSVHVVNRAQIIDDALNLARASLLDYNLALDLVSYLSRDTGHMPWTAGRRNLRYVEKMLERTGAYGVFKVCQPSQPTNTTAILYLP